MNQNSAYKPFQFIIFVSLLVSCGTATQAKPPNILLLIVDDLRPTLGAYGDPIAHTPNMDRLAERGLVFLNNYANVPVCGASRASMLSARAPTLTRFRTYNSRLDEDLPNAVSLPEFFKNQGYHTAAYGKIFDSTLDSADAWSAGAVWSPEGDWNSAVPRGERREDLQKAYLNSPDGVPGPAFERLSVEDNAYPDGKVADRAIADILALQDSDFPFLKAIGLRKPHLPFTAPEKYWQLYDRRDFNLPATFYQAAENAPPQAIHNSGELRNQYTGVPAEGVFPEATALELIHAYYAAVSYSDANIGRVLDALEEAELQDNTIVALVGDHGWNLGENTLWAKHSLFDISMQTPMIIYSPAVAAQEISAVTSLLSLFPTLADLAGFNAPSTLDGKSLVPLLNERTVDAELLSQREEQFAVSRWLSGDSIKTEHFRYSEWQNEDGAVTGTMMYDHRTDAVESRNISNDDIYRDTRSGLREALSDYQRNIVN